MLVVSYADPSGHDEDGEEADENRKKRQLGFGEGGTKVGLTLIGLNF